MSLILRNPTKLKLVFCKSFCSKVLKTEEITNEWLVPQRPVPRKIKLEKLPPRTKIDSKTIALLERLSLVDCANKKGIETLEDAIHFADQIQQVNTEGVEPLVTVLEDFPLRLREDEVTEGNIKKAIFENAAESEDDYFVAPPGNIPLEAREDLLFEKNI